MSITSISHCLFMSINNFVNVIARLKCPDCSKVKTSGFRFVLLVVVLSLLGLPFLFVDTVSIVD